MTNNVPTHYLLDKKDILILRTFFTLFWVLGCFGFVYQELIPPLEGLLTPINIVGDAVLMLLGLYTLRKPTDALIIASFFILSFVSSFLVNNLSLMQWANGTRSFYGAIFLIPVSRYIWSKPVLYKEFIKTFDKYIFIWLCVQAVCVVEQFIRYGAGDKVGGSFGDGGSGMVSFGIYFFSFYLLNKRLDHRNAFQSIRKNIWLVILLFPTFLNETKVSFILLLMYFFLLFPINRDYIKRVIMIAPVVVILMGGALIVYIDTVEQSDSMLDPKYLMEEYLNNDYTEDEMAAAVDWIMENETNVPDLPRFAKMGFISYVIEQNGNHWLVGLGLQGFNGATNFKATKVVEEYNWFYLGTNPYVCFIIVQLGLLGLIWAVTFYTLLYKCCPPGYRKNKNIYIYSLLSLIINLAYSDIIKTPTFSFIFFTFTFLQWVPKDVECDVEEEECDAEEERSTEMLPLQ